MMPLAVLLGFVVGLLTGGTFSGLKHFVLRAWWLLPSYLLLDRFFHTQWAQFLNTNPRWITVLLLTIQYACILILVFYNRHYKGLLLLGFGEILNIIVIFANLGRMPVSRIVLASDSIMSRQLSAGLIPHYALQSDTTKLAFLGDVLLIPFPFAALYSIGDVVISLGLLWFTASLMHLKAEQKNIPG